MPPTSNIRKTSYAHHPTSAFASTTTTHPDTNPATTTTTTTRRTASGRAVRTNTTRPANYYARPFGLNAHAADNDVQDPNTAAEPGFFPALQYFSDAITALPREVMRQFTLMKEVEAKIHGPRERMGEVLDGLMELPIPPRRAGGGGGGHAGGEAGQQGLLSLTANNSAAGSTRASLINGVAGQLHSAQNSVSGSQTGEEIAAETEEELARRRQYYDLRLLTHNLLPNLDEKNVVLAEANRVLALQLSRLDSVLPHISNEISEEARLGSMTHWAYSDNRLKKNAPAPTVSSRRDVAATNSLAAAASAVHEKEILQARHDAGWEAQREKVVGGKGKRQQQLQGLEYGDSEFEDRPVAAKKTAHGKVTGKGKAAAQATGLGISSTANGEPVKRRKVDKGLSAPGMERSASNATNKGSKANRETPRSTPAAAEPSKKLAKAKPAPTVPKKRIPNTAANSPAMASSPLQASFGISGMDPPSARPQSARLRQNSTTNLRHERLAAAGQESSRPSSAAGGKKNGNGAEKSNGKRKMRHEEAEGQAAAEKTKDDMKREDIEMPDATAAATTDRVVPSRTNSGKTSGGGAAGAGGRKSATGTPRTDSFPDAASASMLRTRSTRSLRGNAARGESSASDEPREQGVPTAGVGVASKHKHNRTISNSHLVKQLAPFNRSPDLDRHRGSDEEDEEDEEGGEGGGRGGDAVGVGGGDGEGRAGRSRGRSSRPVSRRNTLMMATSPDGGAGHADAENENEEGGKGLAHSSLATSDAGAAPASPGRQRMSPTPMSSLEDPQDLEEEDGHGLPPLPHPRGTLDRDEHSPMSAGGPASPTSNDSSNPGSDVEEGLDPSAAAAVADPPNPVASDLPSNPASDIEEEDEEEEVEEGDPDDPNEPKYCYCNRGSYGEMVACDNEGCEREWFHLGCTELMEAPGEEESWFCEGCRKALGMGRGRKRGGAVNGGGGGRGRGR